jgi:hypothetical protein
MGGPPRFFESRLSGVEFAARGFLATLPPRGRGAGVLLLTRRAASACVRHVTAAFRGAVTLLAARPLLRCDMDFSSLNRQCITAFGQTVTYQPAAGAPFQVAALVERATDEQRRADGVYARLFTDRADFGAAPAAGDEVIIGDATYKVFEVMTDPAGGAWLSLRENI